MKVGDTVFLISGSPALSVIEVEGDEITCSWTDSEERKFCFEAYTLTTNTACQSSESWNNPFESEQDED